MGDFDCQLRAFFDGANKLRSTTEDAVFWFRSVNRYAIAGDTTGEGELNSFMDSLYELREVIPVYHESCHNLKNLINLSLIHNINADHLQVVLYGDRAANSAAEAVVVLAEVVAACLRPLDQWQCRKLPRLGYMPDIWAKILPVCKRIRKSLGFLEKQEFVRLEAQLEIEETRVRVWSLAIEERERERKKQGLREKIFALRGARIAQTPPKPAELSRKQKLEARDEQIKWIYKNEKPSSENRTSKWQQLADRANDDPIIKQLGLKPITRWIARNVIEPPCNRSNK